MGKMVGWEGGMESKMGVTEGGVQKPSSDASRNYDLPMPVARREREIVGLSLRIWCIVSGIGVLYI